MATDKRVLSCIQPSGDMHLGNYFGAIKNWVALQNSGEYECVYGIVDLHAMTLPYEAKDLKEMTWKMAAELMACGIDPEKSVLFIQSLVPEHTELSWILSCVTSYGELSRMTQFKDKSEFVNESGSKNLVSAGLFTYPILQSADILVYRAGYVPVGKDQEQHLELSRNTAIRFNNQFGEFFPEPQPLFTEIPKLLSLADPEKKMSKSLGDKHIVGLFEAEDSVRKKVKTAVTDSGQNQGDAPMSPGLANLFELLKACEKHEQYEDFKQKYKNEELRYGDFKNAVADALVELTQSFIAKRDELMQDKGYIERAVYESSEKARAIASDTMKEVRRLTGLPAHQ